MLSRRNYTCLLTILLLCASVRCPGSSEDNSVQDLEPSIQILNNSSDSPRTDSTSVLQNKSSTTRKMQREEAEKKRVSFLKNKGIKYLAALKFPDSPDPEQMCNYDLLRALGMSGQFLGVMHPSNSERSYCSENQITCCTGANIESLQPVFLEGVKQLKYSVAMIEELLTLFRGEAYKKALESVMDGDKQTQCDYVFEDPNDRIGFVQEEHLDAYADTAGAVLARVGDYLKNQLWFHADFVCAACNPINHPYFKTESGEQIPSKIIAASDTCVNILKIKEFEAEISELFVNFLVPYANLAECIKKIEDEGEDWFEYEHAHLIEEQDVKQSENDSHKQENQTIKDNNHDAVSNDQVHSDEAHRLNEEYEQIKKDSMLPVRSVAKANQFVINFRRCYYKHYIADNGKSETEMAVADDGEEEHDADNVDFDCSSLCARQVDKLEFQFPFFNDIAIVLRATFNLLSEKATIEEYYANVRGKAFDDSQNDEPIVFFKSDEAAAGKLNFKWDLTQQEAVAIFRHRMSKKFTMPVETRRSLWQVFVDWLKRLFN